MKRLWVLCLAACAPSLSIPPTIHPTGVAAQSSAGVSMGGVYTLDETDEGGTDDSQLILPWGEGWVRWGMGGGQLELRVLPGLGSVGYRVDLTPMGQGAGFALVPSGHAGLFYAWSEDFDGDESSGGLLALGAGLTGLVTFPTGQGFFYIAPRLAITNLRAVGDEISEADSVNLLTFGAAVGINLGGPPGSTGVSLELAIQRTSNLDSDDGTEPLWVFAPTLGLAL